MPDEDRRDTIRTALSMIRADWQGDDESSRHLWESCEDREALARELAHLCRETMERLAAVAGVSTGEMLHRQAARLVPPGENWRTAADE
ncbi:MAG: hypothetical protein QOI54_1298 [Actinomycetota bacterium]|jgi:hypothetical protein|nr:hypothetical protein [Actinomycetota bacterium]